jgi:hypothetical protein
MKTENFTAEYLNTCLLSLVGRQELVDAWWNTPNKAFDCNTPKSVYKEVPGGVTSVTNYILGYCGGGYY